jgi:hypothetical protein
VSAVQDDRDKSVAAVTLAYNMTPNTSTGFSPMELLDPEAARLLPLRRELGHADFAIPHTKSHYRTALLRHVHAISRLAKANLESQICATSWHTTLILGRGMPTYKKVIGYL